MRLPETEIVRLERASDTDFCHWWLWGLSLFQYNRVTGPIEERPDVVFLRDLTSRFPCVAHVSSLALKDRVDSPEEMFGPPAGPIPYLRTRIGFHDHFYDLNLWPAWENCVFPQVTPLFWQALLHEEGGLKEMMGDHGLAFYVAPHPGTTAVLPDLLRIPFPGETEWLQRLCALYALVVTVGHDGHYFHVYAQAEENLQLLIPSLQAAIEVVERSAWFQEHRFVLRWDEEDGTLRLPE